MEKVINSDTSDSPNKQAMIEALIVSLGVVSSACRAVGISRECHYEWMKTDESYATKVTDVKDVAIDFVESKMFNAIENGDSSLIKYYLSTQGRKRGYVDKQEIDLTSKGEALQSVTVFQLPDNGRDSSE